MSESTADPKAELGTTRTISGVATARSPIHSGSDDPAGNSQPLRTEKIRIPTRGDNAFEDVPFIAGNSVRGHIRRLLAGDLLGRIDYTVTDERLFHLLRAGGVLESGGKAEIDVGMRREIRDAFPIIDLLGGSTGNQMFGGTVDIHHMTLCCRENNWRLREENQTDDSCYELEDDMHQIRSHDNPDDTGMRDSVDYGFDFDAESEDAVGSQQMIYKFDTLVAGSEFEHSVRFESYATELARATMCHGLRLWQEAGTIGGMASSGLGRVDIEYDTDLEAEAEPYLDYVAEHGDRIVDALDTLARK